jgi:flagellar protein FliO/FliZ
MQTDGMPWGELLRVVLTLLFIILLIIGLSFALRRAGMLRASKPGVFQVLAAIGLGGKDKIYLIQVGQEQLVVGSSLAGLSLLHTMQEAIPLTDLQPQLPFAGQLTGQLTGQRFAEILRSVGKGAKS